MPVGIVPGDGDDFLSDVVLDIDECAPSDAVDDPFAQVGDFGDAFIPYGGTGSHKERPEVREARVVVTLGHHLPVLEEDFGSVPDPVPDRVLELFPDEVLDLYGDVIHD